LSEISECIKARSLITSLKTTTNNTLAFCTKLHGVKIFSPSDCSIKHHFTNQYLDFDTTAVTFNHTGKLIAFAKTKVIYIADIDKKEIVKIIPTDSKKVHILSFDDTSNYIIAGNEDGRVMQYNCFSTSALARLCSFPHNEKNRKSIRKNYVSALCIEKNRLACSGLGGAVVVIDLYSRANKIVLQNSQSRINALHFVDSNTLVSANFDGLISIYSLKDKKLLKEIDTPLHQVRQIIAMPNPNFIMLCSNTNYVSIVDIKNHKFIHHKYIEFKDKIIRIANIDESSIAVALKNGMIEKIELTTEKDLKSLILHNSLDKAYELIEKEPMLKDTNKYKKLEQLYSKIYSEAIKALINENNNLAKELLKPYETLVSKKKEISSLYMSFRHYKNLKLLYLSKKFPIAYALCAKYPELEHTPIFKKMEENWRDIFKNAQRQMLLNKQNNAKALLDEYKTVASKKEMIALVLNQNRDFVEFILSINKKDYAKASSLANKNKLLKKAPTYTLLKNELDYKLEQIKTFIYQGDVDKARIALSIIKDVEDLKTEISMYFEECKHLEILQKHYKNNNLKRCYETLDEFHVLYTTELGEILEKHWAKLIHKCEEHALKGNVTNIKETLGELIDLDGRLDKIGDLFRLAFHVKIKAFLSKRSYKNAEKLIYSYLDIFGMDSEISTLTKKYEKRTDQKLAITQDIPTNRNNWIHSDLVK